MSVIKPINPVQDASVKLALESMMAYTAHVINYLSTRPDAEIVISILQQENQDRSRRLNDIVTESRVKPTTSNGLTGLPEYVHDGDKFNGVSGAYDQGY